MVLLNSLKLTPYEPTNRSNSFLKHRRKLIAKIDEQILLATDSNYKPTKIKWVRNEDGAERKLEIPKRVRLWWTENLGGTVLLTIRYGNKLIEFEKGQNAIELSSKVALEPTLQNIKEGIDKGEFDRLLDEQLAYGSRLAKQ